MPLSNLAADEKRSNAQPAQLKTPVRCSLFSGLLYGVSVPALRRIWYWLGVSSWRHSASVWTIDGTGADGVEGSAAALSYLSKHARAHTATTPTSNCRRVRAGSAAEGDQRRIAPE
ncbi:hypothetical protein L829_1698 [Mycobacteroides abscessus MAB_030201_1075]|uniref:Uncharacterized protein n=1 Tax=Mycobacteroides abscessus MAB_030201_1075 TaxID=1335410 RepID=A0A829PMN1_9MYCO|nr:hypothetical protein MA3A0122R_3578 [Mycobacteroides abscessus 3A-0122-R]ETZ88142.1 hypothetical protein L829_1698 [Mycobacteroides abscessus MAB_030201_1075]